MPRTRWLGLVATAAGLGVGATLLPHARAQLTECTVTAANPLSCQVPVDSNLVVRPPSEFSLSLSGGADGGGSVTSSPTGIDCSITRGASGSAGCSATFGTGQMVSLTAAASSGSVLKAWAGAGCDANGNGVGSGSGICVISMDQARAVVVSFEAARPR